MNSLLSMHKTIAILFAAVFIAGFFTACKKKSNDPDFQYEYFPVDKGHYVTYAVREVKIDDGLLLNDTTRYFLKAVIGDTIIDNEGRVARRYERYVRNNVSDPWVLKDIWTTIINGNKAELMEENQRTIKLIFAPDKLKEWDANAYNMLGELTCYYRDIGDEGSINGFQFESTVTVEQENFFSLIDYRRKYEQYAKGVGMYYKHYKDYKINNFDTLDVTKGNELMMRLIDYGTE